MKKSYLASLWYHHIFDYPLTSDELKLWEINEDMINSVPNTQPLKTSNYYCFSKGQIKERLKRQDCSIRKLEIAKRAANVLAKIPTILFVGITGSLAMNNAKDDSDIDLLFVTSKDSLWSTRVLAYVLLKVYSFPLRVPQDKNEQDKLCLNIWMDESDLKITQKNLYTAHEICQIVPIVNKGDVYQKFMSQNKWVENYWSNQKLKHVLSQKKEKVELNEIGSTLFLRSINNFCFFVQHLRMKKRITRELVTKTRAFFHPFDWGEKVEKELLKRKVILTKS